MDFKEVLNLQLNNAISIKFTKIVEARKKAKKAKCIVESIASLAKEAKASKLDVSISSIIPRNDNWNNKVMEVNSYLKDLCESNDIPFYQ